VTAGQRSGRDEFGLPVVPPIKSNHSCRVCRRWLEGAWAVADPQGRAEIQRQMDCGRCDDCTWQVAVDRAAAGLVVQPVPDPGDPAMYAQLVLAGVLIDLAGRPLRTVPCEHGARCPAGYHIVNVTDPLSLDCPRCHRGQGQLCRFPRPFAGRRRLPRPSVVWPYRLHPERERFAQLSMDWLAAAGDLTVPAPWPTRPDPPNGAR
jgi:hypothetical protein